MKLLAASPLLAQITAKDLSAKSLAAVGSSQRRIPIRRSASARSSIVAARGPISAARSNFPKSARRRSKPDITS